MDFPGEARSKAEEIARRRREIYERDIRSEELDRENYGEFLMVDATTGDYAVDENDDKAFDRAEVIRNAEGEEKTPSLVLFGEDGVLVG